MKIFKFQNIKLGFLILCQWFRTVYLVTLLHPDKYLAQIIDEKHRKSKLSSDEWTVVKKVVRGTLRISPLFQKKRRCLIQSLIVYQVLKRQDIQSDFQIGAKKGSNNDLSTHAWVEIEGQVIIGGLVNGYRKLIRTR